MSNQSAGQTSKIRSVVRRAVVGSVVVGTLSMGVFGLTGTAGAASTTGVNTPKVGAHFSCARADQVLTRIDKAEARINAGLPKLTAAQKKAAAAGHTKRAAAIEKRITRLESSTVMGRLTAAATKIEKACPGSAPTTGSNTSTTPGS